MNAAVPPVHLQFYPQSCLQVQARKEPILRNKLETTIKDQDMTAKVSFSGPHKHISSNVIKLHRLSVRIEVPGAMCSLMKQALTTKLRLRREMHQKETMIYVVRSSDTCPQMEISNLPFQIW